MNTTENNKLLAEFLGMKIINFKGIEYVENTGSLTAITIDDLESFTYDWNWLMLVVEKIEQTETKDGRTFTIDMHRYSVLIFEYGLTTNEIIFTEGKGRLENLYNACVEFVKWWNEE